MKKPTLTLGARLDAIFALDQSIDVLEAALRAEKQLRAKKERALLSALQEAGVDGCKGKTASAAIKLTRHPGIKNRHKLDVWMMKHNMLHLLQNRVSSKAYFELVEDGVKVPGIEVFEKTSLSITKRRK